MKKEIPENRPGYADIPMTRFACNGKQIEQANANENKKRSKTHVEITRSVSLGPNVSILYSSGLSGREGLWSHHCFIVFSRKTNTSTSLDVGARLAGGVVTDDADRLNVVNLWSVLAVATDVHVCLRVVLRRGT